MAKVWKYRMIKDELGRIYLEPLEIVERKELREANLPGWDDPWNAKELEGRLGGGVALILKYRGNYHLVLNQRTPDAERAPGRIDIGAGVGDATEGEFNSKAKVPKFPMYWRLLSELYEFMIMRGGEALFIVPVPSNLSEDERKDFLRYMKSTAFNTLLLLNPEIERDRWDDKTPHIVAPANGVQIIEKLEDKEYRYMAYVTFEPEEKSMEIIFPVVYSFRGKLKLADAVLDGVKVRGNDYAVYDGEHFGSTDKHDLGLILKNVTPLNRAVMLFNLNTGELVVYRNGKMIYTGGYKQYVDEQNKELSKNGLKLRPTSKVEVLPELEIYDGNRRIPMEKLREFVDYMKKA